MHHKSVETMIKRRMPVITALALMLIVVFTGACNKSGGSLSPTDTVKAYYDAANKKDIAGIKKYLSQGTIKMMEVGAKNMGKNLDDALKESAATAPQTATPKFSNEKITGDSATVDIASEGQTVSMPLIKEGGEWKLAIDKLIQTMQGSMGTTPSISPSDSPSAPLGDPKMGNSNEDEGHDNDNH
jgi:flagellar hook-associated protein FlgK